MSGPCRIGTSRGGQSLLEGNLAAGVPGAAGRGKAVHRNGSLRLIFPCDGQEATSGAHCRHVFQGGGSDRRRDRSGGRIKARRNRRRGGPAPSLSFWAAPDMQATPIRRQASLRRRSGILRAGQDPGLVPPVIETFRPCCSRSVRQRPDARRRDARAFHEAGLWALRRPTAKSLLKSRPPDGPIYFPSLSYDLQ